MGNLKNIEKEPRSTFLYFSTLFAYAIQVSFNNEFDGVLYFRAKTSELVEYYAKEFGAVAPVRYDPFRMLILEEAAAQIISEFR